MRESGQDMWLECILCQMNKTNNIVDTPKKRRDQIRGNFKRIWRDENMKSANLWMRKAQNRAA